MTLKDPTGSHAASPCLDHPQFFERALSRRRLLRLGAWAAVSLGAASLPIWRFGLAAAVEAAHDIVLPNPIPGGLTGVEQGCPGITELFHLFVPSYPAEDEPSSITDFNGFHGDAHIQGVGTATNTATGKKIRLFYDADLRFMKGVYIGVDGKTHDGTFGFVWLDNYSDASLAIQTTSIDPGNVPGGLFWTIPIPSESVTIHLGDGTASLSVADAQFLDFGTFCNDLAHGPSLPATASFKVQWSGVLKRVKVRNAAQGFAGEFIITNAAAEWNASVPGNNFEFVSDPAATSSNLFAQIGRERNGVFFNV